MGIMIVRACSRPNAVEFCTNYAGPRMAMISVSTPDPPWGCYLITPEETQFVNPILRLEFHDVDDGNHPGLTPIMGKDAQDIARFVQDQLRSNCLGIVVHCDTGCSRSVGIAAAIAEYISDHTFSAMPPYNMRCYRMVRRALRRKETTT